MASTNENFNIESTLKSQEANSIFEKNNLNQKRREDEDYLTVSNLYLTDFKENNLCGEKKNLIINASIKSLENFKRLKLIRKKSFKKRMKIFNNRSWTWSFPPALKKSIRKTNWTRNEKRKMKRKHLNRVRKFSQFGLGKRLEVVRRGKRGSLGGKAKGKFPHEETYDKSESDEDCENGYYHRISLGHFQQLCSDDGEASTSNREDVGQYNVESAAKNNNFCMDLPEEKELLQLQEWGRSSIVYSFEH